MIQTWQACWYVNAKYVFHNRIKNNVFVRVAYFMILCSIKVAPSPTPTIPYLALKSREAELASCSCRGCHPALILLKPTWLLMTPSSVGCGISCPVSRWFNSSLSLWTLERRCCASDEVSSSASAWSWLLCFPGLTSTLRATTFRRYRWFWLASVLCSTWQLSTAVFKDWQPMRACTFCFECLQLGVRPSAAGRIYRQVDRDALVKSNELRCRLSYTDKCLDGLFRDQKRERWNRISGLALV